MDDRLPPQPAIKYAHGSLVGLVLRMAADAKAAGRLCQAEVAVVQELALHRDLPEAFRKSPDQGGATAVVRY